MSGKSMINDLTTGSVTRRLLVFALPFILSNLLQTLYNMVDMIVVGQFVGPAGLSAVSIGGDLLNFLTFVSMGITSASQVIISQNVGAGRKDAISQTIGATLTIILSLSIVVSIACICLADPLLRAMNTSAEAYSQARDYSVICYAGLFFVYGYNAIGAILRGMGDSRRPFIFICIAAISNLILDLLFVAVFNMAAAGAALATVMGQAISFITSIVYLYRRRDAFGFDFRPRSFIPQKDKVRQILALGLPMTVQSAAVHFSMLLVNSSVNSFGMAASAATGVGNKLTTIATVVTGAMSTAGSAMTGQNMGAGKTDRVTKILQVSLVINLAFCSVLALILFLFPTQVFSIFNTDPEVLEYAIAFVPCGIINFLGFGLRAPFLALVNGIGFATMSLIIGLLDGVVARIGLSFLLGYALDMGITGFWYGNALAGLVPFIVIGIYYLTGKWKTRRLVS